VWAAGQERIDAVDLLVGAGFDVNALGRSDLSLEQKWQTALHTAVERDNADLARRLLVLGADPDMRDRRFDGTPLDWLTTSVDRISSSCSPVTRRADAAPHRRCGA
jgi:ankyrin repeat protein